METNYFLNEQPGKNARFTPAELIKIHIKDPNHVVTEEEMKKLVVGDEALNTNELSKDATEKKEELDHLPNSDKLPNPYNVLR